MPRGSTAWNCSLMSGARRKASKAWTPSSKDANPTSRNSGCDINANSNIISTAAPRISTRRPPCAGNDHEGKWPARRDPRAGSDAHPGRTAVHHDAGRHGRRGDQGRAARSRRRYARLGSALPRRRGRVFSWRQSQQALVDGCTGMLASTSLLAALNARHRSGKGQKVGLSLYETSLAMLVNVAASYLAAGRDAGRFGNGHPSIVPYTAYRAADAMIAVGI